MSSLNLTPSVDVFPCPNCRETINTTQRQCSFCGTEIDRAAAEVAAAETRRISSACSDASYLKIMLGVLIPFALLAVFPFLGLMGLFGFVFIRYATPIMAIRWWIKYARVKTTDQEFHKARKTVILVSIIATLLLIFLHVNLFGARV